jgi:hypothetical protein
MHFPSWNNNSICGTVQAVTLSPDSNGGVLTVTANDSKGALSTVTVRVTVPPATTDNTLKADGEPDVKEMPICSVVRQHWGTSSSRRGLD